MNDSLLKTLSNKKILITAFICMAISFVIAMFFVNPAIDGKDGSSVLALQLAFDKALGIEIINSWGVEGQAFFRRWIITDYLYAACYSLFLASLLSSLIYQKGKADSSIFKATVPFALLAGACDWLENSMEYLFLANPLDFPDKLFFLHSLVAVAKWAGVLIVVLAISVLAFQSSSPKKQ